MIDIFGHIFFLFILLGIFCLGQQKKVGWIIQVIGNLGWITNGIIMGMTSIWVWNIFFMLFNMWGYKKWRK